MKSLGYDFKKEISVISESGIQKILEKCLWNEWIIGRIYSNPIPSYTVVVLDNPTELEG